jgi:hypothetical protein
VELGESAGTEGAGVGGTIPMADVNAYTKALTAQNGQLKAENTHLRTQAALAEGEAKAVMTKAGVSPTPAPKTIPTAALPKSVQEGAKVMDDMQNKVKALEGKLADEQAEVDAVKLQDAQAKIKADAAALDAQISSGAVGFHYHLVPYFKVAQGAKEVMGIQEMSTCRSSCDSQTLCKSYSWSDQEKKCFWSVSALDYDDEFTLGVKATASTAGDPDAKWRTFPGMKFINAQSKERGGGTEKDCQNVCSADISCKSYSYRPGYCSWSETGLGYDENFHYYEKGEVMSAEEAGKRAKIEKERAALNAALKAEQDKRNAEGLSEEKELAAKDAEKAKWLGAEPNSAQELQIKQNVKQQEQREVAKLAAAGATAAGDKFLAAQKSFEERQMEAVKNLSEIEANEKKLKSELKAAKGQLLPDKESAVDVEVELSKQNNKRVLQDLDVKIAALAVDTATTALEDAQKANDAAAIASSTQTLKEAKNKLNYEQDKLAEIQKVVDEKAKDLADRNGVIKHAETKIADLQKQEKAAADGIEDSIKEQKRLVAEQKAKTMRDKLIAEKAKMNMFRAREKEVKADFGNAKVAIWKMKDQGTDKIKTDDERVQLERQEAAENGKIFKRRKRTTI